MKILLLSPLPPPSGGIARWTQRYLTWSKEKHNVIVVNTALIGKRAGEAGKKRNLFDEIVRAINVVRKTKEGLKQKPDILHVNTSCSKFGVLRDWICIKYAKQNNTPIILHCHCNVEDQLGVGRLATKIFADLVAKSCRVLVLNDKSLRYVRKIDSNKPIVCPNFVLSSQIAKAHRISDKIEKVIYVGDVRFTKGSDDFYMLAKKNPDKQFITVGSVTDEMLQMKKPENLISLGRMDMEEVEKQLDDADVFVFPSITEGFSNALLEAMARGLPVIATDVGANKDMIEKCGGEIVAVHDVKAMGDALKIMDSPEIREKMSTWNIHKVKRCYEYNQVLNKIFQIYEESI